MIIVNHSIDYKIDEEIVEDMFKKIKGRDKRNISDEEWPQEKLAVICLKQLDSRRGI